MLGAIVIVVATAAATAAASFNEIDALVAALNQTPKPKLAGVLTVPRPGEAQTILIMGSDKRSGRTLDALSPPHTDTMMLARIDPRLGSIAVMSIPRDLKVQMEVPGHGMLAEKINAAYSFGGAKQALRVVERTLGIQINHLVDTNFGGFQTAVDYLGCAYIDVDHHYFNNNAGRDQYATINVPAGYQRLCGSNALDYVRYRHTDSDFVRVSRQQDFLRQLREQVGTGRLISQRVGLARIFGSATETDIHSADDVLRLARVIIPLAGHPTRQVHFQANPGRAYVTASPQQIAASIREFMGPGAVRPRRPAAIVGGGPRRGSHQPPDLEAAPALGQAAARAMSPGIPIYYPTILRAGATYDQSSRAYLIRTADLRLHRAYRIVVKLASPGDYYGVQGTDWRDPPLLANPSETRTIAGRRFELFYSGSRLRLVSWRTRAAVYWVSNTLQQALDERQMLSIAASTRLSG
ncbi:MAG: hypothetical protein NVSMB25_07290 [Thermoleophilaceae bacterium]